MQLSIGNTTGSTGPVNSITVTTSGSGYQVGDILDIGSSPSGIWSIQIQLKENDFVQSVSKVKVVNPGDNYATGDTLTVCCGHFPGAS